MLYARQSTAIIVTVGPCLDADGVADTGVVVGAFLASKNGAAPAALNGSATLTHRNTGNYSLSLTTTDTNTVGTLELVINDTVTACPIKEIQVLEEAVYDALFAAAVPGYGTAQTGDSFARLGAPAGASVSADIAAIEAQTDDIGAAGAGLTALGDARLANLDATVSSRLAAAGYTAPDNTSIAAILVDTGTTLDLAVAAVKVDTAAILLDTAEIGAAGAGLTALATQASVNTIDDFLDTEVATLTTAVADLPTNAELATALGTADDAVLAQVALVKAKTDSLTFTVAGQVDANVTSVNDVTIVGDGSATPFNV